MTLFTKWIKTGNIHDFAFVGKEIIATATGNHVVFYNLVTKEENIECFNNSVRGEGVCCLAGHPIVPIFSTVERRYHPKIYIHTYPRITKVAECNLDKDPSSYISCCFVGTEYLVSLTSYPNFQLIVWCWKTGKKISSVDTLLRDEVQSIEASLSASNLAYQFSSTSGKLLIHEIYTYSKKVTITTNCIKSIEHKITCVCWTKNSNLLLCDIFQNVFILSNDGKKVQMILRKNQNISVTNRTLILSITDGFLILDNNLQLTCYKKPCMENNLKESWNVVWFTNLSTQIVKMKLARHKEVILLHSENGKIFEISLINGNKPELREVFSNCRKFKLLCLLNPERVYGAAVDSWNCLVLINLFNGSISANFQIEKEDEVIDLATHPYIPLMTAITSSGKCIFFIATTEHLTIFKIIYLQRQPLNNIKFSTNGNSIGVSSKEPSKIFLLETVVNKEIELLILVQTFLNIPVGNCIEIYSVNISRNLIQKNNKVYTNIYYENLNYHLENENVFIGLPYLLKQLHFFKLKNNYESLILFNVIHSEHKLKKFNVNISKNFIITSGFDGLIFLRETSDLSKSIATFMTHHYQEKGTKNSIITNCGNVIVCLGKNGSIVGLQFREYKEINETGIIKELQWKCNGDTKSLFCDNQTWLEHKTLKMIEFEKNESPSLRNIILTEIKLLKEKVKKLLNLNENKSVEFQLPISTFDLNVVDREDKINAFLLQQENTKMLLQQEIDGIENIISYLIANFLNMIEIYDSTLISFNGKTSVKNFLFRRINKLEMNDSLIELFDTPLPNINVKVINDKEFETNLEMISRTNTSDKFLYLDANSLSSYNHDIILSGSTSCKWLKDDFFPNELSKLDFNQINYDIITSRQHKLKIYFNERFDEMKNLKDNLFKQITDWVKTLDRYKSEMKNLFGTIVNDYYDFHNITCQFIKNPSENLIIIQQDIPFNVETNDYSNNKCKDSLQDLNCDNVFREEKLNEMMEGVLEIGWEDKIAKDIPKPRCLLSKNSSKYDEEDLKVVETYNEKVKKLEIERQKYKKYLELEINNINDQIRTGLENFDDKMEEFAIEKIQIQSAILQEFLLHLTKKKTEFLTDYISNKICSNINNDLLILENKYKNLINEITYVQPIIFELRVKYDNLNKRNKVFDDKFRGEFYNLKQPIVEHLLKQYKRRPQSNEFTYMSLLCLAEMNKCLIDGRKSEILPQEYLDFLYSIDAMDVIPSNLPQQIDATCWQSLCRLRRNKIELEIKLKMAALELAEADQAYFYLQKWSSSVQNNIYCVKNTSEEEKLKQSTSMNDFEAQLVLKSMQIEVDLTGSLNDFNNATLVIYKQLVDVNNKIKKEGGKKINAMRALMILKKSILYKNWEYQCTLKRFRNLQEHLLVLQKTKVGKKIQTYLIEKLEKKIRPKHPTNCDAMLKSVEKKFQRMLKEKETNLQKLITEIKYWRQANAELMTKIEKLSLKKVEVSLYVEGNDLQKRNKIFKQNYLRSIMERTRLVKSIKESSKELFNLQTQLELLKWKTYPTLRSKNSSYYTKSGYFKNNY